MFKKYFIKKYKSLKGYLLLKMQVAVILTLLISIFSNLFKNYLLFVFEVIPFFLLATAFKEFKKNYSKEFSVHFLIFSLLFFFSLVAPLFLQKISASMFPSLTGISNLIYIICAVLIFFIFFKIFLVKNYVIGEVLLSDKNIAVVKTDFDFFAGLKAGKYVVENKGARKGQKVKVLLKRRSGKPEKIIEVLK